MNDHSDDALPEWTQDELMLLRSADRDHPPARSLPAALAAAGVGGAIVSSAAGAQATAALGSAAVAATKWSGVVLLTKWIAVVAVSGVAIAGGVALSTKAPAPQAPRAASSAPARVVVPEIAAPAAPPKQAEAARPARTSFKRPLPSQPDIRVELAAVDAAMKALRDSNAQEALAALDRYDASFGKGGSLRVEATALRIEALVRTGDRAKADALASAFLSKHPKNPYAARVRALIGSPSDPSRP
jgi:hypothetical protein